MGGGGQPYSIKSNSNTISQIPINNTISNPITNNTESLDSKRISESKSKNSNIDSIDSKQTLESNPKTPKELKDFNINSNIDSTESKDFKDSIKAIESKQMLESNKSNLRDSKDCNKAYTDSIKYLESNLTDSNKYNADTNPKDSKPSILSQDSILFKPIDTLTQELFDTNSCKYLPKLYAIYKSTKDIDFDKLPNSFVLKTNHDCGGVVLVPDKEAFLKDSKTFTESMDKLTKHLNTNFYTMYREWHYKDIEPRIFAEEMLEEQRNGEWEVPENYRMFCFQDNIFIQVDDANYADTHKRWFYNQEWVFQDFSYNMPILSDIIAMPQMLCDMKQIANHLTKQIGFVRVDLYILQCRVIVGELTFTPVGGTGKFTPKEWDKKLGDLWMLE